MLQPEEHTIHLKFAHHLLDFELYDILTETDIFWQSEREILGRRKSGKLNFLRREVTPLHQAPSSRPPTSYRPFKNLSDITFEEEGTKFLEQGTSVCFPAPHNRIVDNMVADLNVGLQHNDTTALPKMLPANFNLPQ